MFEALLATTTPSGRAGLGTAPQRSHDLVAGTVGRRLSPRHAALFAEPVAGTAGDVTDWYATVPGRARPLADLPDTDRVAVLAELDRLRADIAAMADVIASEGGAAGAAASQRLAEALRNALVVPGEDCIHAVETADGPPQPVLVMWGWTDGRVAPVRGALAGADPRTRPVASPPPAAAAPFVSGTSVAAPWLWGLVAAGWVLLALLSGAILWLMIPACGLSPSFLPRHCPEPPLISSIAEAETAVLEDEVAQLIRALADADRACQPLPPPPPPPPPEPEPQPEPILLPPPDALPTPPRSEIDRRLDEAGAQRGQLTVSLAWNSRSDLDLHVTCPNGAIVSFRRRQACGGVLDVDANAGGRRSNTPVENVFFASPMAGRYRLRVHLYSSATGGSPEPFEVQVRDGARVEVLRGTVTAQRPDWTADWRTGRP
jgi:hypothetical protein